MKTVKEMYRFFDSLYVSIDSIDAEVLQDWSHKETPKKVYAVIDIELSDMDALPVEEAYLYSDMQGAIDEMNEFNN